MSPRARSSAGSGDATIGDTAVSRVISGAFELDWFGQWRVTEPLVDSVSAFKADLLHFRVHHVLILSRRLRGDRYSPPYSKRRPGRRSTSHSILFTEPTAASVRRQISDALEVQITSEKSSGIQPRIYVLREHDDFRARRTRSRQAREANTRPRLVGRRFLSEDVPILFGLLTAFLRREMPSLWHLC